MLEIIFIHEKIIYTNISLRYVKVMFKLQLVPHYNYCISQRCFFFHVLVAIFEMVDFQKALNLNNFLIEICRVTVCGKLLLLHLQANFLFKSWWPYLKLLIFKKLVNLMFY